ncbi:MAG: phosphoribosyl-ATP diphosphatase [Pseudomonadota bacterium]
MVLERLWQTIESRKTAGADQSYTASLLEAGVDKCAKKFGEEAVEAIIEAVSGDRRRLTAEVADVMYHLLVLLAASDVDPAAVARELSKRAGVSGHAEKAARKS